MAKQTYTTGQVLTAAQMTTLQANDYNQTVNAKTVSYTLVASDAGTRITMNSVSSTSITVNTSVFTAGDTLIVTNIGTGACTITAGTATVSTSGSLILAQYDSGTLYFSSTGVAIWTGANPGDITGVTAGTGISGGGTSGTVTITNSMATAITTAGDTLYGTGSGTFSRLGIGSTGQVLTVASGIPSWATPASASSFVGAYLSNSTNPAIANTTLTTLAFNQEAYDTSSFHDNVTNNSRMTIPSGKAGYYLITANGQWDVNAVGRRELYIYKNGSNVGGQEVTASASAYPTNSPSLVLSLAVGDYIEIKLYQGSGGNITYYNQQFQISYLGA